MGNSEGKPIFPNTQAQNCNYAGFYNDINPKLIKKIKGDKLVPKPLLVCSGGTSSRCAAEGHWTLDLRENFKSIKFNKEKDEVVIEGGVNMEVLINKLSELKRTFPIGVSGITGIGYILTGGISPLSRKYGLAIDQVLEIKGYWGNGDKFSLSKPNNSSRSEERLVWKALCGAAPFLAIITELRLKTYKLNPLQVWETTTTPDDLVRTIGIAEKWPDSASLYWVWGERIKCYGIYECNQINSNEIFKEIIRNIPKSNDFNSSKVGNINHIKKPVIQQSDKDIYLNNKYSEVLGLLGGALNNNSNNLVQRIKRIMNKKPNKYCHIASQQLGEATTKQAEYTSFIHRDAMWKPWITGSWDSGDEKGKKISLKWIENAWEDLEDFFPGVHLAQIHPHLNWHKKELQYAYTDWLPKLKEFKLTYDPKGVLPPL